jgi:hypothetical protein
VPRSSAPNHPTPDGLAIPDVDHMFNKNVLNDVLDRMFGGGPAVMTDYMRMGLWINFVRLTDKALREYDAARAELIDYVSDIGGGNFNFRISPYVRAVDHMENAVSATHQAVLDLKALHERGVGAKKRLLTELHEERLRKLRHSVEQTNARSVVRSSRMRLALRGPPALRARE